MPDNLDPTQVQGGEPGGTATPAAPVTSAEPVAPATPSAPPPDAEARKAELEQKLTQYEADIRALKSTSDKRFNEAQRQWQTQQAQMQKEVQALRLATMDDDERKAYEANLLSERQQQIENELVQARTAAQEYQANIQAIQYFLAKGVPADKLVIDQGYDTLFNSGMEWMDAEMKRLRTNPNSTPRSNIPATPPPVAVGNQGVPNTKPTWTDLRTKYGSDEDIYRMFELGFLTPDQMPE